MFMWTKRHPSMKPYPSAKISCLGTSMEQGSFASRLGRSVLLIMERFCPLLPAM